MFKKIFMLLFVLTLVSACASTKKTVTEEEEFDVVETQEQATQINKMNEEVVPSDEISVPNKVYFGFDKYNITKESAKVLDLQAEWLKNNSKINIILEGHCDERGTREYNLALGKRRADAVKNYLVSKGISANRIKTISYGKERPLVIGTGEAVWAKNRVVVTDEQ